MSDTLLELSAADAAAQVALGRSLAPCLPWPGVVFLHGELGAGKTTLVRGILRGLGHQGNVKSPTYTLIEPYPLGERSLYHLDLYRVGDPGELEFLGLRDLLGAATLLLVEWPERGQGELPGPDLEIHICYTQGGRLLQFHGRTPMGESALGQLAAGHLRGIRNSLEQ